MSGETPSSRQAAIWWERALRALRTSERLVTDDPEASVSRAYYAAFYAVSALFALEGKSFRRHTAVEAAVHRDLVKTGRWASEKGAAFSSLFQSRMAADYGTAERVGANRARHAVAWAREVVYGVHELQPAALAWGDEQTNGA